MNEAPNDPVQITHENIEAIFVHEQDQLKKQSIPEKVAHTVAQWAGTVSFIAVHLAIFIGWTTLNLTVWQFDPFPFTLLTTLVSLEAILLSGFLLLSQNRLAEEADKRHKLDLQINLLAERESTAILRLLDKIAERLDVRQEHRTEAQGLSDETNPTAVLEQIVEIEKKNELK
jgi:uncharacterized membrane protein